MNDIQQIIVYRNPMEAYFWNNISGIGPFFILFVVISIALTVTVLKLTEFAERKYFPNLNLDYSVLAMACIFISLIISGYIAL